MKTIQLSDTEYKQLQELKTQEGLGTPRQVIMYALQKLLLPDEIIDLLSADNKSRKTQDQWISYFNNLNQRMIAGYDLLKTDKIQPETLKSIKKDCINLAIITSTRNSYNPNNLSGKITHNYGSLIVQPTTIPLDNIPIYERTPIKKVVETSDGLKYFQALANDINITKKEIIHNLEILSYRSADEIFAWTPDQNSRARNPEKELRFSDLDDRFHVFGDGYFNYDGHSRGMFERKSGGAAAQK